MSDPRLFTTRRGCGTGGGPGGGSVLRSLKTRRSSPSHPRYDMAMFRGGGRVWVIGGRDGGGDCYNDVWWFHPSQRCWLRVTANAPWSPRSGHMACGYEIRGGPHNVQLVVMGGIGSTGASNEVWTSRDGVSWTRLPDAPWGPRYHAL